MAIALTIRFTDKGGFGTTPTDFLIIIAVSVLVVLSSKGIVDTVITAVTLKAIILFYGCELLLNKMKTRWNVFTLSVLVSLSVISARGLLALVT
jgi:UDP-GlcNAc:undecaprenyl-phosphate GlcNAc-1-phosphate transferase